MSEVVELLISGIGQLCVVPSHGDGPQRGHRLGDLGLIENAALAIDDGKIIAFGPEDEILGGYRAVQTLDAGGRVVTPGLVDAHTHLIWAGDRAGEFERRLKGVSYQQIMAEGGGINSTVRATRKADLADLVDQSKARLNLMLAHGSTTVEVKTGYGLRTDAEIAMLNAIALLDAEHPVDLVATFLGAHAVPPEFEGRADEYVDLVINEMIPAVCEWRDEHWPSLMFCDVFCDEGAFTLGQSRRILEAAAARGMGLKIHADEFANLGGVGLAVELGAVSADHLVVTSDEEIVALGRSDTIAVALPATPFGLAHREYTPARKLLDAGAALALGSDCNPGTAWCENMQITLALATRYLGLTQAQAIAAATVNAAFALGLGDRVGSLEPGKMADVLMWDVRDYRMIGYRFGVNLVQTVIKGGRVAFDARWGGW